MEDIIGKLAVTSWCAAFMFGLVCSLASHPPVWPRLERVTAMASGLFVLLAAPLSAAWVLLLIWA